SASRLAALVLILAAAPASARIAVLPLSGPRNTNLERQLSSSICARMGCVPASTVMSGKKVDWDKVRRAKIEGVVVGGLSKATRPRAPEISSLPPAGQRPGRQPSPVPTGRLPSPTLPHPRAEAPPAPRAPGSPPPPPPPAAAAAAPPAAAPIAPPPPGEIAPP